MKKLLLSSALMVLFTSAQAIEIYTARGKVNAPENPKKVASLDIGVIDTLNALGIQVSGVPENLYIKELVIDNAEVVGNLFEPDMEKLHAMNPDWILVATLSADKLKNVSEIGSAADLSLKGEQPYFQEMLHRMQELGKVFGKEKEANEWQDKINKLIKDINKKIPKDNKALVLLNTGPKMSVFGDKSRFGWLGTELGFDLIETEKNDSPHGAPISFEYIAKVNPEWLLVIDRGTSMGMSDKASSQTVLDNQLVKQTTAWKKGQVIYLRPADIYVHTGGVQATERVLKQLDKELSQ